MQKTLHPKYEKEKHIKHMARSKNFESGRHTNHKTAAGFTEVLCTWPSLSTT